ncbi:MAG: MerR family transcriptional regulator [Rivularia sp. ALOHA_DT_140]|nr:MerR family transcriptional regulator [Rivularia sp. ALOHA_DT_140]
MSRYFTKKEVSQLTGLNVRQLDYIGKDGFGVVPQSLGKKHTNVVYSFDQIVELMIGIHLKENLGFSYSFIKQLLDLLKNEKYFAPNYLVMFEDMPKYKDSVGKFDFLYSQEDLEEYSKRIILEDGKPMIAVLSLADVIKFVEKIIRYTKKININEFLFPDKSKIINELKNKAIESGIDVDKIPA